MKRHLREQLHARERTRLLFVRRPDRRGRDELLAYTVESSAGHERIRCTIVGGYEELRRVDLLEGGDDVDHPLFLVCTHGKHDPCCARRGRPLYEALAEQLDDRWVWQTTHVGGDRFAGNVVCLPHGLYYGRVDRGEAVDLVDAQLAGRILLDRYRGRSCWPFAAQAAERSVREATGMLGIDDLRLLRIRRDGSRFHVVYAAPDGTEHAREVVGELGTGDYLTCTAPQPERPRRYVVTG